MSRLPSIDIAGALYYVQLQSNGHCQLLTNRDDFEALKHLFPTLAETTGGRLLGYCLFQDSLHLLVRAGESGISNLVQWLVDSHTQAYNQQHQRNGSLYSQQSLSVLIEPQHYLLPVIHKLHWLPVKSGLVSSPLAYPWSSHRDYLSTHPLTWLDRQEALVKVANHRASQLRRFERFIEDGRPPSVDWIEGVSNRYRALASEGYIDKLLSRHQNHQLLPVLDLNALTDWVCREYELEEKDLLLWRHHRLSNEVQAVVGALALTFKLATISDVADYFDCDKDVLASGIRALEARRGMYLFKLQLGLDRWLISHFQNQPPTIAEPDPKNAIPPDQLPDPAALERPATGFHSAAP